MEDLDRFDDALVLGTGTNIRVGENACTQVVLPVYLGGIGIRKGKNIDRSHIFHLFTTRSTCGCGWYPKQYFFFLESNDLPVA